jgi:hypothetical protein
MTYQPKHRGEPVVKHRITVIESERGWGRNEWTEDYDTPEEARRAIRSINSKNKPGPAPDYYIQAYDEIREVTL